MACLISHASISASRQPTAPRELMLRRIGLGKLASYLGDFSFNLSYTVDFERPMYAQSLLIRKTRLVMLFEAASEDCALICA